jgi:hypothetical protein
LKKQREKREAAKALVRPGGFSNLASKFFGAPGGAPYQIAT